MFTNSGVPDQTLHYAASDLGLQCFPMSHKKGARLIWVNILKPIQQKHFEMYKQNCKNKSQTYLFWH